MKMCQTKRKRGGTATGEQPNRVAILTDSTCDLPQELREKHDIHVIPLQLIWGEETLYDGRDIDAETFYRRLPVDPVHPKTSQPSVGDFAEMFRQIAAGADEIVAVLISNGLSGTIASAEGAKEMVDIPVHIVDSRTVSLGLGAVVMAAIGAREAGVDSTAIVAAAERRAANSRAVIMVDTLEYLHKGGRIGGAARMLGTALDLKPVLHLEDGRLELVDRVRTRSKAIARMLEVAIDGLDKDAPLGGAVLHSAAPQDAARVAEQYQALYKPREFMVSQVTPTIGVHVGPRALGVISYNL
jgi:DegV family protein with EDD domain